MEYKRQAKRKKFHDFFVLNNELTWKRLCRCSNYVVNIILKHNKSTKHIIFH
jgi:predicted nucleic acid-binding Zn finger protein